MTPRRMTSTSTRATSRSSTARASPGGTPTPRIWRVEDGVMVGETVEGKPKGNNYIVYRGDKTRDFDLKLQMKIEKGGGGGIQYRSVTGVPWTRPQPDRPAALRPQVHDDRPAGRLLVPGQCADRVATRASGTPKTRCRAFSRIAAR